MRVSGLGQDRGHGVTQLGEGLGPTVQVVPAGTPLPAGPVMSPDGPVAMAHAAVAVPAEPTLVTPGTLMEKEIPVGLVTPYLTGRRWVIAGFAYRADDALDTRPAVGSPGFWLLRWRALAMQSFRAVRTSTGDLVPAALFIDPGPVPVGTEMYRVTSAGEEFVSRHDGSAWVRRQG
jgi:hypothetical protein